MRKTVLLIEDDFETNELYVNLLERKGFSAIGCMNAIEGLDALVKNQIALVILDIKLPDYDGFEVCNRIRKNYEIPIIFVSSESSVDARIKAYEHGADAYLTKPINVRELFALIEAQLRRSLQNHSTLSSSNKLWVNLNSIYYDQNPLPLTPLEHEILSLLLSKPSTTFSREEITSQIPTSCSPRSIDYHIKNIRIKLKEAGMANEIIRTVYGEGYRVDDF